jgi:anti-sigma factor RsiW
MSVEFMNGEFECERTLLVQADFDGELDAAQAVALIEHERQCAHCRHVREQLTRSRALMRAAPRYAIGPELRASLAGRLRAKGEGGTDADDQIGAQSVRDGQRAPDSAGDVVSRGAEARGHRRWFSGAPSLRWGAAIAAAAVVAAVLLVPRPSDLGAQLVGNHLRAMQLESHLIDVVSSDHHTVKPWFAGKVSFAPIVKQLESDGYVLKGGRVDIVNGAPAAVLVYAAGHHIIDVYMWPATAGSGASLRASQLNGFNLRYWQEGDLTLWCISDASPDELARFAARWQSR